MEKHGKSYEETDDFDDGEPMTQERFDRIEGERKRDIEEMAGRLEAKESAKREDLYFVFPNKTARNKALSLVNEYRFKPLNLFRLMEDPAVDPNQPELGLKLEYSALDPQRRQQLDEFFRKQGLSDFAVYPLEGQRRGDNVVEFPKSRIEEEQGESFKAAA